MEKFAGIVINWAPIARQWKGLLEDISNSARTILANRKAVSGPGDEKVLLYDTNCSVCQHQLLASDYPTALCLSLFHRPGQTVDQCTVQLSGTNCATTHSQGHTANFGFPSVGEIHFKHWQHLSWECNLKISLKNKTKQNKHTVQLSWHVVCQVHFEIPLKTRICPIIVDRIFLYMLLNKDKRSNYCLCHQTYWCDYSLEMNIPVRESRIILMIENRLKIQKPKSKQSGEYLMLSSNWWTLQTLFLFSFIKLIRTLK